MNSGTPSASPTIWTSTSGSACRRTCVTIAPPYRRRAGSVSARRHAPVRARAGCSRAGRSRPQAPASPRPRRSRLEQLARGGVDPVHVLEQQQHGQRPRALELQQRLRTSLLLRSGGASAGNGSSAGEPSRSARAASAVRRRPPPPGDRGASQLRAGASSPCSPAATRAAR